MAAGYRHQKKTLENGLTVVTLAMPHLHSATVAVFCRVGSRHETEDRNGLSHLLEHMFFRGCAGYPDSTTLNAAMEDLGGTLNGCTMRDLSAFHSTVHPDHVLDAIELWGQLFSTPRFRELEIERSIILEEMLDSVDQRGRVVDLDALAHREAFPGHPLGQPIDGTRGKVRGFSLQHLRRHRRQFYGAQNLVVCCAGRLDPVRVERAVRRAFGGLFPGRRSKESPPEPPRRAPRFTYVHTDDAKSRFRVSFRTAAEEHADYPALLLLRRVLDGGLSSRLQVEMIEQRGLAYEAGAEMESYSDCGLFDFEFAVSHRRIAPAFQCIAEILADLEENLLGVDELERVRHRARIALDLGLDSAFDLAHWYGATQLFRDPVSPEERIAELSKVTREQLRAVVARYFRPERLTVAAVGGLDAAGAKAARRVIQGTLGKGA